MHCTLLTDFCEPPLHVIRMESADSEAEEPRNLLSLCLRSCDYDCEFLGMRSDYLWHVLCDEVFPD